MGCYAGFLAGREAARLMLPRGRGLHLLHRRDREPARRHGLRGIRQRQVRPARRRAELPRASSGPKNIHVAHLIIDAGVDTAFVRERIKAAGGDEALANIEPDQLMRPNRSPKPTGSSTSSRATPGRSSSRSGRIAEKW